jgi:hypothetical protein
MAPHWLWLEGGVYQQATAAAMARQLMMRWPVIRLLDRLVGIVIDAKTACLNTLLVLAGRWVAAWFTPRALSTPLRTKLLLLSCC